MSHKNNKTKKINGMEIALLLLKSYALPIEIAFELFNVCKAIKPGFCEFPVIVYCIRKPMILHISSFEMWRDIARVVSHILVTESYKLSGDAKPWQPVPGLDVTDLVTELYGFRSYEVIASIQLQFGKVVPELHFIFEVEARVIGHVFAYTLNVGSFFVPLSTAQGLERYFSGPVIASGKVRALWDLIEHTFRRRSLVSLKWIRDTLPRIEACFDAHRRVVTEREYRVLDGVEVAYHIRDIKELAARWSHPEALKIAQKLGTSPFVLTNSINI